MFRNVTSLKRVNGVREGVFDGRLPQAGVAYSGDMTAVKNYVLRQQESCAENGLSQKVIIRAINQRLKRTSNAVCTL